VLREERSLESIRERSENRAEKGEGVMTWSSSYKSNYMVSFLLFLFIFSVGLFSYCKLFHIPSPCAHLIPPVTSFIIFASVRLTLHVTGMLSAVIASMAAHVRGMISCLHGDHLSGKPANVGGVWHLSGKCLGKVLPEKAVYCLLQQPAKH